VSACLPFSVCPFPVEVRADDQRDRTIARGIQAPHQNPDGSAIGRNRGMLFWALLASGQITMRKGNGWQSLGEKIAEPNTIDLAA
jgi:hypothetical protein